jgi:multiple sugar transport system permease protein
MNDKTVRKGLLQLMWRERWAYLFLAVPLMIIVIFVFIPIVMSIMISMQQWDVGGYRWVGAENFIKVFKDDLFWNAMKNTAIYTFFTVPLGLVAALLLAALLVELPPWLQSLFRGSLYLPVVVSGVVMAVVWQWMLDFDYGLLNYLANLVGLQSVAWIGNKQTVLGTLIGMAFLGGQGASVVLLSASMNNIPRDYYESALLDGANRWRRFLNITLPLTKPTTLYLMIVGTIASFQVFVPIYIITKGGPNHASETIVYRIFTTAFDLFDFGRASAMAVVLFVVIALVAVIQYRMLATDVEY